MNKSPPSQLLALLSRIRKQRTPARIALAYALFAGLWIIASDPLLAWLVTDPAQLLRIGAFKGLAFVAVTAGLLYLLLLGHPADAADAPAPWSIRYLLLVFLGLALVPGLLAYGIVRLQGPRIEADALANLEAIARLKADQIETWLGNRQDEGVALAQTEGFALRVEQLLQSNDARERELVRSRLDAMRLTHHYEGAILLDTAGRVVTALGERTTVPAPLKPLMQRALTENRVLQSDLYRDPAGQLHLDWLVPITRATATGRRPLALVVFHVEPERFLYPLIQSWPTPSASAETVLTRRDGDQVLFLNELRHKKNTALSYRYPLTMKELPAAVSILSGKPARVTGSDYRGIPVLAAVRPVEGTGWYLVVKLDRDEVMAPLHTLVAWVSLVTLAAILCVAAALSLFWRQQRRAERLALLTQGAEEIHRVNAELEARVAWRTAQLEAANKELEAFSYSVSHDLKAPLRGIDGYSQLLEEDYRERLEGEGLLFLRNIRQGVAQMYELIEDLLAYSRMERRPLQHTTVDLAALTGNLVAERREELNAGGVELRQDVPSLQVQADPEGLGIVLRNLLENAIKFSQKAQPPRIEIGARRDGDKVLLWVRDNGIGFDMKFHDRLFEIFSRLDRAEDYSGTGVGLALVRKATQRMGGRVWAEGAPGQGACFFLELPL